jgi:transcriptional regulator with XRE-family HTH domain
LTKPCFNAILQQQNNPTTPAFRQKGNKEMNINFNKLRYYRQRCGFSQFDLARLVDASQTRINAWENNRSRPPANKRQEIATALNTTPERLFDALGNVLPISATTELL